MSEETTALESPTTRNRQRLQTYSLHRSDTLFRFRADMTHRQIRMHPASETTVCRPAIVDLAQSRSKNKSQIRKSEKHQCHAGATRFEQESADHRPTLLNRRIPLPAMVRVLIDRICPFLKKESQIFRPTAASAQRVIVGCRHAVAGLPGWPVPGLLTDSIGAGAIIFAEIRGKPPGRQVTRNRASRFDRRPEPGAAREEATSLRQFSVTDFRAISGRGTSGLRP